MRPILSQISVEAWGLVIVPVATFTLGVLGALLGFGWRWAKRVGVEEARSRAIHQHLDETERSTKSEIQGLRADVQELREALIAAGLVRPVLSSGRSRPPLVASED